MGHGGLEQQPSSRPRCSLSAVGHPVHAVLDPRPRKEAALTEEHRVIDPGVALVTGLQREDGEVVLISEVGGHFLAIGEGDERWGHLEQSRVLEVYVGSIDGPKGRPDVNTEEAIRPEQAPVGTRPHEGALEALT